MEDFLPAGSIARPGPIGRIARIGLGLVTLCGLVLILRASRYLWVEGIPVDLKFALGAVFCVYAIPPVVNIAYGVSWGRNTTEGCHGGHLCSRRDRVGAPPGSFGTVCGYDRGCYDGLGASATGTLFPAIGCSSCPWLRDARCAPRDGACDGTDAIRARMTWHTRPPGQVGSRQKVGKRTSITTGSNKRGSSLPWLGHLGPYEGASFKRTGNAAAYWSDAGLPACRSALART